MSNPVEALRVLIVDDEPAILELLGEYLRVMGHQVHVARDGEAGLARVLEGDIDVVLTDLKMPGRDGLALLSAIRDRQLPVAVLLMTGYGSVESVVRAMRAGANDVVLKPFRLRDVHEAMMSAHRRAVAEAAIPRYKALAELLEATATVASVEGLSRIYERVVNLALTETGAAEAAIWVAGPLGRWVPVARAGEGTALAALSPEDYDAPRQGAAGVVVAPFGVAGQRTGALGVAGGAPRTPAHVRRIEVLSRAVSGALNLLRERRSSRPAP